MVNKVVLCTGGFDPPHAGHIQYLNAARKLGDMLVVGINSDAWIQRKKGRTFMHATERITIIQNLKCVDHCILFNDDDDTAIEAIKNVQAMYPSSQIIFANGGDRVADNIPEMVVNDVIFKFGVGGSEKINSSSWLLNEWKAPKTDRVWGHYRVLFDIPGTKVKELTINPGRFLSMQRHNLRDEHWMVTGGMCKVYHNNGTTDILRKHDTFRVLADEWHQLSNPYDKPCHIIETQYGDMCIEDDIERLDK